MGSPDDRDVAAATAVDAFADRHPIRAFRHHAVLFHEPPMLEYAHRVVVENRRQQETFRIVRRARHHNLQARHAEQHAMNGLRVLRAGSPSTPDRGPDDHRHRGLAVVHEMEFRRVGHELVECQQHEVGAIVHEHGAHSVHRRACGHAHHRFLRQRRVKDAVGTKSRSQILRGSKHRRRIVDALAKDEHARIVLERRSPAPR